MFSFEDNFKARLADVLPNSDSISLSSKNKSPSNLTIPLSYEIQYLNC